MSTAISGRFLPLPCQTQTIILSTQYKELEAWLYYSDIHII